MKNQGSFIVSNILKICGIIMGIVAVFNGYAAYKHISDLVSKGFEITSQLTEVINYCIGAIAPYVFYGLTLIALSVIITQNNNKKEDNKAELTLSAVKEKIYEENDIDIVDDLINELG